MSAGSGLRFERGLAELQALARRHGHDLDAGDQGRAGAAAVLRVARLRRRAAGANGSAEHGPAAARDDEAARVEELPSGLRLYAADVPMPPRQRLQAEYRSEFVVSLCLEGEVEGRLPDGSRFRQTGGVLGVFHTPGGGSWQLQTGERPSRWRSVAIEVPAEAWQRGLPGIERQAVRRGAATLAAEPWLLALASGAGSFAAHASPGACQGAAELRRQTLAFALWAAGLAAFSGPTVAQVVGIQDARERRAWMLARQALDDDLAQAWTVERLAQQVGLSPRRLSVLFRRSLGLGVMPYLLRQRLLRARALIESGTSVTAACFEVGYDHTASFSRAYRREFGHPPRQTPR